MGWQQDASGQERPAVEAVGNAELRKKYMSGDYSNLVLPDSRELLDDLPVPRRLFRYILSPW